MKGVRTAVFFASADRYARAAISILTTIFVSRIIGPHEFGIAVIAGAALALAGAVRELASIAFIVQSHDLTLSRLRAVTTINLIVIVVLVAALLAAAPLIARLADAPEVTTFIRVAVIGLATGVIAMPLYGVLSRDMKFRSLAVVNIASEIVNSVTILGCAVAGASYLSFAVAQAASAVVGAAMLVVMRPAIEIFRPSLAAWRDVLSFSVFGGGSALLSRSAEYVTIMILGTLLSPATVGLLQRASLICYFPEQTVLAGVNAVALPAFSEQVRRGADLKESYLAAFSRITALIWPCLGLLVILAHPMVTLLLGETWASAAPLVMIIAGGLFLNFALGINYPLLIATGAVRRAFLLTVIQSLVAFPAIAFAAQYGVQAVAWSTYIIVGVNVTISMAFVVTVVPLPWPGLLRAAMLGLGVTGFALAGPALVLVVSGGPEHIGAIGAAVAVGLAGVGWLAALRIFDHVLLREIGHASRAVADVLTRLRPRTHGANEARD